MRRARATATSLLPVAVPPASVIPGAGREATAEPSSLRSRRHYGGAMGILDKFKKQAETMVDKHGDQISKGLDKAAGAVDSRTKGKHTGQIDNGVSETKNALDKLDGKNDDIPARATTGEPPVTPTP